MYLTSEDKATRNKRPRSSLACVRCRNKKVKCDFNQPTCGRCHTSNATCEYSSPPPRVDGQAFDRIGNQVDDLLKKMKRIQSNYVPDSQQPTATTTTDSVHWKLSVTPNAGIRIDTNIVNVNELYQILLNGISQLNINNTMIPHRQILPPPPPPSSSSFPNLDHQQQQLSKETIHELINSYYHSCFLAFTIVNPQEFTLKLLTTTPQSKTKHKLLMNSIFAWVIKHGSTYHQLVTQSDTLYFKKARQLLEKCFVQSSPVTIHALLHLYMYQLLCDQADLAYLYIGLAIRMAQDLEFNKPKLLIDPIQAEMNKRLWWSTYWLDLTAALESNRPTMFDDSENDLEYPQKLDFEDEKAGDRIDFCVYSIQLLKIRKKIIKTLPSVSGQSLLASVAAFEADLEQWRQRVPNHLTVLHVQYHTTWIVLHQHLLSSPTWTPVTLLSWTMCQKHANMVTQLLETYAAQTDHWCHFHYALDGVYTSVDIHQRIAENNAEERQLAITNLLATIAVLDKSPLKHLKKVSDILTSIHAFLFDYTSVPSPVVVEPQEMAIIKLNDPNSSLHNLSITPSHLFDESAFEFNPSIDTSRKRISRDWEL